MKTYWFYLESYTFILEGRQGMLTYNTNSSFLYTGCCL